MHEERASKATVGCTPDARPQIYIMMIIMTMLNMMIIIMTMMIVMTMMIMTMLMVKMHHL